MHLNIIVAVVVFIIIIIIIVVVVVIVTTIIITIIIIIIIVITVTISIMIFIVLSLLLALLSLSCLSRKWVSILLNWIWYTGRDIDFRITSGRINTQCCKSVDRFFSSWRSLKNIYFNLSNHVYLMIICGHFSQFTRRIGFYLEIWLKI